MPHQCTNCGHMFADGSKEMLSGCPDCGGNKFQFKPAGSSEDESTQPETTANSTPESSPSSSEPAQSSPSTPEPPQNAPETAGSPPETEGVEDDSGFVSKELKNTDESPAQSSARSDVVSSSELTAAGAAAPTATDDPETATDQPTDSAPDLSADSDSEPTADHPVDDSEAADSHSETADSYSETVDPHSETADPHGETADSNLDELRKELNNQFESIRIVSPGQYELNLMELYDREEYIISLREDGRYVIEVPDGWGDS